MSSEGKVTQSMASTNNESSSIGSNPVSSALPLPSTLNGSVVYMSNVSCNNYRLIPTFTFLSSSMGVTFTFSESLSAHLLHALSSLFDAIYRIGGALPCYFPEQKSHGMDW